MARQHDDSGDSSRRRRWAGVVAFVVVVLATAGIGFDPPAGAQGRGGTGINPSCGLGQLTSNQLWTQADAVFAARPVTSETASSSSGGIDSTLIRMTVSEVFKGLVAKELVLAMPNRGCGRFTTDVIMAATRSDDGTYRLLGTVTAEQAQAFGAILPAVTGTGPVRALAAVDGGPVDLVALDADGEILGYRTGSSPPARLALCPEGDLAVTFQGTVADPPSARRIEVLDIATMTSRRRLPWRQASIPSALACGTADASVVTAFEPSDQGSLDPFGDGDLPDDAGDVAPPSLPTAPGAGGGVVADPDASVVLGATTTTLPTRPRPTSPSRGGQIVRFQDQTPTVTPVELSNVIGADAQGRFVGWSDVAATTLSIVDPDKGAQVRSIALPTGLHAQLVSVSDDGQRAVVMALNAELSPNLMTPVLVDLAGDAAPIAPESARGVPLGTVERLGFVGADAVVVWGAVGSGELTTDVVTAEGKVSSSTTRTRAGGPAAKVVPPGAPTPTFNLASGSGLELGTSTSDSTPRLFGVPVGATLFLPASAEVTIDPAAAKPSIAATQRLNNGQPLEIDRTPEDRVAIAISALTFALLLFTFGGLWRYRAPKPA